jgi:ATP-dependent exoDNAse (exonuclease V) beta subunit
VDLLYFDQDTREYVVVDYKTDLPRNERGSSGSISPAYLQQLCLYRRAVAQALSPPTPPRAELWFLKTGDRLVAEFKEEGSG